MRFKPKPEQIEAWVARNFPNYKKRSGGRQLVINNPFSHDDGFHFWISTVEDDIKDHKDPLKKIRGFWVHDFRPGHGKDSSSLIRFIRKYRGITYGQAVSELLGKDAGKDFRRYLQKHKEEDNQAEKEYSIELPPLSKPIFGSEKLTTRDVALNYLHGRSITDERIEVAKLCYTPSTIVFPYFEYGILVYWQERDIFEKRFNFPNEATTGLLKTDYVYGFDDVGPKPQLIVVESIFNKLSIGQNCVATGGATIAGRQVEKLKALDPEIIILAPDNDQAGRKSLVSNYYLLKGKFKLAYALPPKPLDWNDMDQKHGVGSALDYIERNTKFLSMAEICNLQA